MANVPRSSFIPKQVTSTAIPKKVRSTRVFSIFGFISGLLLFVSLVLSGGIFAYKTLEERKLTGAREALAAERGKFNEADIAEVRGFNDRIELAHALLDSHVSPTKVFAALESSTKASVQYTDFAFVRRPSGDVSVDLLGVTDDFAKVALQSLQNSEDFILKDMTVTEVGINLGVEDGEAAVGDKSVSFKLISNIPASKLLFETEAPAESTPSDDMTPAAEEDEEETTASSTLPVAPNTSTSTPAASGSTASTTGQGSSGTSN